MSSWISILDDQGKPLISSGDSKLIPLNVKPWTMTELVRSNLDVTGTFDDSKTIKPIDVSQIELVLKSEPEGRNAYQRLLACVRETIGDTQTLSPNWPGRIHEYWHDVAVGLVTEYSRIVGNFNWNIDVAEDTVRTFIDFVISEKIIVRRLFRLSGLDFQQSFNLGPNITIKVISTEILMLLGDTDRELRLSEGDDRNNSNLPRTNWWIVEYRQEIHKREWWSFEEDDFAVQLQAILGILCSHVDRPIAVADLAITPYETSHNPYAYYGRPVLYPIYDLSSVHNDNLVSITRSQIRKFQRRSAVLLEALKDEDYYLHAPLIRLGWAQDRMYISESLVDCVIGLESIFAENSGEIGYKLRNRCAVFIGRTHEERVFIRDKIAKLYDFRSRFVHGKLVQARTQDYLWAKRLLRDVIMQCAALYPDKNSKSMLNKNLDDRLIK